MTERSRYVLGALLGVALAACVPGEEEPGSGEACGSRGLPACGEGEYCQWEPQDLCGAADAPGQCTQRPEVCTREYAPVCGCDGETYANDCVAASSGVSVAKRGECEGAPEADAGSGDFCGGFAGIQCPDGQYCNFDPSTSCGAGDQGGLCAPVPDVCAQLHDPVCGCDGATYSNRCLAASKGVSVAHQGACGGDAGAGARACGGLLGLPCGEGEFCSYPPSAQCGAADAPGACTVRPDACTLQYDPVCGCDGKTYGNACAAASAGMSIIHDGEC